MSLSKGSKLPLDPMNSIGLGSLLRYGTKNVLSARSAEREAFHPASEARDERPKNYGGPGGLVPLEKLQCVTWTLYI